MTRTIHPVGQGAFYSETFFDMNDRVVFAAVYDCGGKKGPLQLEIRDLGNRCIDILFISHFHYDHIGGIPALMERNHPRMVIFPGVSPATFAIDVIYNSLKKPNGNSIDIMLTYFLPNLVEGNNQNGFIPIHNGEKKSYSQTDISWEYDVMYFETAEPEHEFLIELLKTLGLPEDDFNNFHSAEYYRKLAQRVRSRDIVNIVKGIMEDGFEGNHNSYSLQVYSHQLGVEQSLCFDCLYMGDIKISNWYQGQIKAINPHYLQIPHHGSSHNYASVFLDNNRTVFISVGDQNPYHHPGMTELNLYVHSCKDVRLVTEEGLTKYEDSRTI